MQVPDASEGPRVERWESRPVASRALKVAIFLIPLIVGFAAGASVAQVLPDPRSLADVIMWWLIVVATSSVTATIVDRFARRLLPLSWLLEMTMLFPDKAPTRYRVAKRTGNVTELKRRITEAQEGGDPDLGEISALILSLATALSNHDRKTRGHSERTRAYTDMIAEEMNLVESERDKLRWAALLHDVGKLEVSTEVLNKDGTLDDDEWHQIRRHPIAGMRLVAPLVPWLGQWAKTIEHHHERWDGTGYPYGLAGTEINLGARIVSVADAYDVMTAGRNYQDAKSPAAAREEVALMAGKQFDPAVVRALMSVSLGRLRWVAGPLAGVMQLPFLRGLPAFGRDAATLVTSGALMTTTLAAGLVTTLPSPATDGIRPQAEVVAAAEDPNTSLSPPDTASGPFSSAAEDVDGTESGSVFGPGSNGIGARGRITESESESPGGSEDEPPGETSEDDPVIPDGPPPVTAPGAPLVTSDAASTAEDVPVLIDVLGNDTARSGSLNTQSLRVVNQAGRGVVARQGQLLRYIPRQNLSGTDQFGYEVCDDNDLCSSAVVTVEVTPVNDAPMPTTASGSTSEDTATTISLTITDVEDDALTCDVAGQPGAGFASVDTSCGNLSYTPATNFNGSDNVQVSVFDGTARVVFGVTIAVAPVNDAPVANPDESTTTWNAAVTIPVTGNDTDVDGDTLTAQIIGQPGAGTAAASGGAVVYTPTSGVAGTFKIAYQACDQAGACSSSSATVVVTGVMVAVDDQFVAKKGGTVSLDVFMNDIPGSGSIMRNTWTVLSPPTHGTVRLTGSRIQYRVDRDFVGMDSFTYRVCDSGGSCDSATVTITVTEANTR